MQEYLSFLVRHWELAVAAAVTLLLIAAYEIHEQIRGVVKLIPQRVVHLINREQAVVVDIRTQKAFAEGHLLNAINIPHAELAERYKELEKYMSRPVVVVCTAGNSSLKAAQFLKRHGFEKSVSLKGGMNAWREAGLPITTK